MAFTVARHQNETIRSSRGAEEGGSPATQGLDAPIYDLDAHILRRGQPPKRSCGPAARCRFGKASPGIDRPGGARPDRPKDHRHTNRIRDCPEAGTPAGRPGNRVPLGSPGVEPRHGCSTLLVPPTPGEHGPPDRPRSRRTPKSDRRWWKAGPHARPPAGRPREVGFGAIRHPAAPGPRA